MRSEAWFTGERWHLRTPQRMLIALIAPLLVAALTTLSLYAVISTPVTALPEIYRACVRVGLDPSDCTAEAAKAGVYTVLSMVIAAAAIVWISWRYKDQEIAPAPIPTPVVVAFLIISFSVVLVHMIGRELAPAFASRLAELREFSNSISIENVLWPLLVQLLLTQRDPRIRVAITGALTSILTLTIFRTAGLTVIVFGFIFPLACLVWDAHLARWKGFVPLVAWRTLIVACFGGAVALSGVTDTQSRAIEASPTAPIQAPALPSHFPKATPIPIPIAPGELSAAHRFRQRLAYPLYQAAVAEHLSKIIELPTIRDEFLRKFRLSSKLSLNEYIHDVLEPGSTGEITSLYYGEGHAYFGAVAKPWILLAPLLFVVIWFSLYRAGIDTGALVGIQLWRSSFSGFITIVPSLIVQLATLCGMSLAGRFIKLEHRRLYHLAPAILLALLCLVAVTQILDLAGGSSRKSLAQISLTAADKCALNDADVGPLTQRVDRALQQVNVRTVVTSIGNQNLTLLVPSASSVLPHLQAITGAISASVECSDGRVEGRAIVTKVTTVSGGGFLPLSILALVINLCAATAIGYRLIWRQHSLA